MAVKSVYPQALATDVQTALDSDDWETLNGVLSPKSGTAPNGVGIATATTKYTYTGTADFGSAGSNISYVSTDWSNGMVSSLTTFNSGGYNTTASSPYAISSSSVNGTGLEAWRCYDGITTARWASDNSGSTTEQWNKIDLGSGVTKTFVGVRLFGYQVASVNTKTYKAQGSNDDSSWTDLLSVINVPVPTSDWTAVMSLTSTSAYRYYRILSIESNGDNAHGIGEIDWREGVLASSDNTVTAVTGLSSEILSPSSIIGKTNAGATINDDNLNIQYNLNGSGYNSLETLTLFKQRGDFTITSSFDFRIQPIAAQVFDSIEIYTPFTQSLILANGSIKANLNGVTVGEMNSSGYTFPDETTQATSILNYIATLPTSDPSVSGEAWNNSGVMTISAG